MGEIPTTGNMISAVFVEPKNGATLAPDEKFEVKIQVKNFAAGKFTDPQSTYYSAPQQLNKDGHVLGHTHVVIEPIDSLTTTAVSDPRKFAFFKGVNDAQNGQGEVIVPVAAGLAAGVYKMSTINSASTHQPVIVPVAQHGSLDDTVYVGVAVPPPFFN